VKRLSKNGIPESFEIVRLLSVDVKQQPARTAVRCLRHGAIGGDFISGGNSPTVRWLGLFRNEETKYGQNIYPNNSESLG